MAAGNRAKHGGFDGRQPRRAGRWWGRGGGGWKGFTMYGAGMMRQICWGGKVR